MSVSSRLHWLALSPEATLPKSERYVCPDADYSPGILEGAIFRLDRVLRKWQHIFEFCEADDCLLRAAIMAARKKVALPDGNVIYPGDEMVEIHWWNEHVARLVADQPALVRAKLLPSLVEHSFEHLAKYVAVAPEARGARFIHGNAVLPMRGGKNEFAALLQRYGFWVVRPPAGFFDKLHDFFEEYLVRALLWAFHRRKTRKHRRRVLRRVDLWASRSAFLARYLPEQARPTSSSDEALTGINRN
ncbi:MAG: YkoP family protein [Candidatus Acidiferrales bacterium]